VNPAHERYLAAQQALLTALEAHDDGGAFRRAAARLSAAHEELVAAPEPDGATLDRMRSLAALLEARAAARRSALVRELGRTRLALDLARKRSRGARTGRRLDVAG
jgi:hypothetical protein